MLQNQPIIEEEQTDTKRKWISIRIDEDLEKRLSDRGKFKQSYNDVISEILDELETLEKKKAWEWRYHYIVSIDTRTKEGCFPVLEGEGIKFVSLLKSGPIWESWGSFSAVPNTTNRHHPKKINLIFQFQDCIRVIRGNFLYYLQRELRLSNGDRYHSD